MRTVRAIVSAGRADKRFYKVPLITLTVTTQGSPGKELAMDP